MHQLSSLPEESLLLKCKLEHPKQELSQRRLMTHLSFTARRRDNVSNNSKNLTRGLTAHFPLTTLPRCSALMW